MPGRESEVFSDEVTLRASDWHPLDTTSSKQVTVIKVTKRMAVSIMKLTGASGSQREAIIPGLSGSSPQSSPCICQ